MPVSEPTGFGTKTHIQTFRPPTTLSDSGLSFIFGREPRFRAVAAGTIRFRVGPLDCAAA